MHYDILETQIGSILLAGDDEGLCRVLFRSERPKFGPEPSWVPSRTALSEARLQLEQYFAGTRREFALRLAPRGTEFQRSVWNELLNIPYGSVISYGTLAGRIGRPKASRAVGAANGRNPLPIIIPCHRVIGGSGELTGYGGGLDIKRALLDLERRAT